MPPVRVIPATAGGSHQGGCVKARRKRRAPHGADRGDHPAGRAASGHMAALRLGALAAANGPLAAPGPATQSDPPQTRSIGQQTLAHRPWSSRTHASDYGLRVGDHSELRKRVTLRTSQVRVARVDTGSVIPSNARGPGAACGGDSSPAARNDNGGVAARNDRSGVAASNDQAKPGCNDAGLSSRANARDLRAARCRDSSPAARNDNGALRLGMTRAALRLRMTKPSPGAMTLACHPEQREGSRRCERQGIPRLRLGMTIGRCGSE